MKVIVNKIKNVVACIMQKPALVFEFFLCKQNGLTNTKNISWEVRFMMQRIRELASINLQINVRVHGGDCKLLLASDAVFSGRNVQNISVEYHTLSVSEHRYMVASKTKITCIFIFFPKVFSFSGILPCRNALLYLF